MKHWSLKREQEVVLRLLRDEPECAFQGDGRASLSAVRLARGFMEGGLAALKQCTEDPKVAALEKELKRAKRLVWDRMMGRELLKMRIARFGLRSNS